VTLIVSRAATADIERLRAFLIDKNPAAAKRAVAVLVQTIQSLNWLPERGRPSSAVTGARELIVPFGRSAYVVRYVHDARREEIFILRVWHSRETRE
jgi:plasmid stabilization system protein ParE